MSIEFAHGVSTDSSPVMPILYALLQCFTWRIIDSGLKKIYENVFFRFLPVLAQVLKKPYRVLGRTPRNRDIEEKHLTDWEIIHQSQAKLTVLTIQNYPFFCCILYKDLYLATSENIFRHKKFNECNFDANCFINNLSLVDKTNTQIHLR